MRFGPGRWLGTKREPAAGAALAAGAPAGANAASGGDPDQHTVAVGLAGDEGRYAPAS